MNDYGECSRCSARLKSESKGICRTCRTKTCTYEKCHRPDRKFMWIKVESKYCNECTKRIRDQANRYDHHIAGEGVG